VSVSNPVDSSIRDHLAAGEHREAATLALRAYGAAIHRYLCALTRDDAAAYDVFSDFSLDLWRGLPGFRGDCPVKTWAYRVAWTAAQRHFRSSSQRSRTRRLETTEISKIPAESLSIFAARSERWDRLTELRSLLDPAEQTLLTLRVEAELPWTEVALVMAESDLSPALLRKRFERLTAKLHELARKHDLRR